MNPIANNGKLVRSELTCVGSRREKGIPESDGIPCHPPCSVRVLTGLFARMEKGFSYWVFLSLLDIPGDHFQPEGFLKNKVSIPSRYPVQLLPLPPPGTTLDNLWREPTNIPWETLSVNLCSHILRSQLKGKFLATGIGSSELGPIPISQPSRSLRLHCNQIIKTRSY